MDFLDVKARLKALNIDLPIGDYSSQDLESLVLLSLSLPKYPKNPLIIPSLYGNPFPHPSSDPRLLNYEFRKLLLNSKKIGGLSSYSNSLLSVNKLNIIIDLDWTMIYAFRTSMAYSEPQVELELKRLKIKYSYLKLEKKYIPSSQMYLIIAIRPTLSDFLSKLVRIANLFVYTSAEEEYARIVISLIDPTKRLFEGRIFAAGARSVDIHLEKNLELLKLDDLDNVLIVDDQIDVWKVENRDFVIPSMRFTPLFKEDQEFQTSKSFADRIFTYVYEKNVKGYRDEKTPFIDEKGHQLENIFRVINEVYEERFGCLYSETAVKIYQKMLAGIFDGKTCSLGQILGPERENKLRTFTAVVERLGGKVVDENPDFVLVESMQNSTNANAKSVNWLLFKYFSFVINK